jgi:predicted O-methyltransferase YrrM
MAYWGYLGFIRGYLSGFGQEITPKILEIGVHKGQTFIPLVAHLMKNRENFQLTGVDVMQDETLGIILANLTGDLDSEKQTVMMLRNNSLDFLEKFQVILDADESYKEWGYWDVVFLDGDHNYYTVSKELEILSNQLAKTGLMVIDDYDGRWAEDDEYFSEVDGYEEHLHLLAKPKDTQGKKRGVKTAVDEFVENNPGWKLDKRVFPHHTPALLYREDHVMLLEVPPNQTAEETETMFADLLSQVRKEQVNNKVVFAFSGSDALEKGLDLTHNIEKTEKVIEDHEK